MNNMKFELNHKGVNELLRGREMQSVLIDYASSIKNRAGDGYSVHVGSNRANVSVRTDTEEAYQDNLDNNTLLKAMR